MDLALVRSLIDDLEAEINNGGFDQFFFNSAGDRAAETIIALKEIGAVHTANIVLAACSKFPEGMPPKDRYSRQDLLEQVSPDNEAFEEEDAAFYEYKDDLASLVANYLG
jgi:hypothetical protein